MRVRVRERERERERENGAFHRVKYFLMWTIPKSTFIFLTIQTNAVKCGVAVSPLAIRHRTNCLCRVRIA